MAYTSRDFFTICPSIHGRSFLWEQDTSRGLGALTTLREEKGYSGAWLHHKGRNKHHLEYWIDYSADKSNRQLMGMKMPVKYVVEMFCDRVAASKNYNRDEYTDAYPLNYYLRGRSRDLLHPESAKLLESMLAMLAEKGEDFTFDYIRREILHNRK